MAFFEQFPLINYDFNRQGVTQSMTDIFRSVKPLPAFLDSYSAYKFYEIKNGERPDIVAQRIYGVPEWYWTFFVVNDHLHDGYNAWPLSQEDLFDYMAKEYEGYVIEVNPKITSGVHENSLSGKFKLGETIKGLSSQTTGILKKKNVDMCQLVVQNISGGTGRYIGDPTLINDSTELIRGETTLDTVDTYRTYKYAEAPYKYYLETDTTNKEPVTNALHIPNAGAVEYVNITNEDGSITRKYNDYGGSISDSDVAFQTYRNYEFELNESRSKIRYVDPAHIERFIDEFEELVGQ